MKRILIVLGILISIGLIIFGVLGFLRKPEQKPGKSSQRAPVSTKRSIDPFDQGFDMPAATSDPFNDPGGPFYHSVKLATSDDGTHFIDTQQTILEKASVPDVSGLKESTILI